MKHPRRLLFKTIFTLAWLEVALIVLSWLWAAAWPDSPLRSLLTGPGIRWFFGSFVDFTASPVLVWLVVWSFALSAWRSSGLQDEVAARLRRRARPEADGMAGQGAARSRFAAVTTLVVFGLLSGVLLLLSLPRHAVLLSITGTLFPGSFAAGIVPAAAFVVTACSLVYGVLSFRFRTPEHLCRALCRPPRVLPPLLLLYVLASQLWATAAYILNL